MAKKCQQAFPAMLLRRDFIAFGVNNQRQNLSVAVTGEVVVTFGVMQPKQVDFLQATYIAKK